MWILEDNQATIKIIRKGFSQKLRSTARVFKVNVGAISDTIEQDESIDIMYCHTDFQAADIFTKALQPHKWINALALLGIDPNTYENTTMYSVNDAEYTTDDAIPAAAAAQGDGITSTAVYQCKAEIPEKLVQDTNISIKPLQGLSAVTEIANDVSDTQSTYNVEKGGWTQQEADQVHANMQQYVIDAVKANPTAPISNSSKRSQTAGQKLKGWGHVIEVCTSEDSNLSNVSTEFQNTRVTRITQSDDFSKRSTVEKIKSTIQAEPGTSVHGSLPCTAWCSWQSVIVAKGTPKQKRELARKRALSIRLLEHFAEVAEFAYKLGGEVSFEWPGYCSGWIQKPLVDLIQKLDLYTARPDGCACGLRDSNGVPIKKPWRFVTSS